MLVKTLKNLSARLLANQWIRIIFILILLAYAFLFIFFYRKHGLAIVAWHVHLMIPVYILVFLSLLQKIYNKVKPGSSVEILSNLKHYVWIYIVIEGFLILIRPEKIQVETSSGYYWAPYNTDSANYYHVRKPGERYRLSTGEFNYPRVANSLGLPDHEWKTEKSKGSFRILCLGDSFTEGDGAPYDSSYVAILRTLLQARYPLVEVLNAGNCGSDPFFNFKNLEDRLIAYQPDLVIQSFTTNDLDTDMMIRGGMKRFQEDGTLKFRYNHWWEPVFACSYVARIMIITLGGYNNNLVKKSDISRIRKENESEIKELFTRYQAYSSKKGFDLFILTFPFKSDLNLPDRSIIREEFIPFFERNNIRYIDLRSCYKETLERENKKYTDMYWIYDGHHNPRGYNMMAKCIADYIEEYMNNKERQDIR